MANQRATAFLLVMTILPIKAITITNDPITTGRLVSTLYLLGCVGGPNVCGSKTDGTVADVGGVDIFTGAVEMAGNHWHAVPLPSTSRFW